MSTDDASDRTWAIGSAVNRMGYYLESLGREIRVASEAPTGEVLRPLATRCLENADWISGQLRDAAAKLLMALEDDPEPEGKAEPASPLVNMAAFWNDELEQLPQVEAGQLIDCPRCGDKHMLTAVQQQGEPPFLVYSCRGRTYLGGVGGRLVAGSPGDGS